MPLKNKRYLNVIFQNPNDDKSYFMGIYKMTHGNKTEINNYLQCNPNRLEEIDEYFNIMNCKNKIELIQKKQILEEELAEKREHTNCMNMPLNYDLYEENPQIFNNPHNYFYNDIILKCKKMIILDKQAFYESVVEQLLIYELTYYEGQINLHNKGLDDITKEIICLTHFLNYKESMKQINLVKARLYKTLSESIKHKNFSHTEELEAFFFKNKSNNKIFYLDLVKNVWI